MLLPPGIATRKAVEFDSDLADRARTRGELTEQVKSVTFDTLGSVSGMVEVEEHCG